jgi:hypothetical protein
MSEEPTCGTGLAERAVLPAQLATLAAALADTLETHMHALDLSDEAARREHEAYASLVAQYRRIGAQLRAIADEMTGYRDLPMGRHDMAVMTARPAVEAFERFLAAEKALLALLQTSVAEDEAMT